jgi:dipeptidyl-peptidase-4
MAVTRLSVPSAQGSLLLVHGLIDENVHFRHTARLIQQLIAARKRYQLLLFPGERHTPRYEEDRLYMEEAVFEFVTATVQRQCAH